MSKMSVAKFISDKRAEGLSDSKITHDLLDAGWHMDIIHKVMHGEPIKHRSLDSILDIKKQPYKKAIIYGAPILIIVGLILFVTFI